MSFKTYHVKLNGKVYEVEVEEVKACESIVSTEKNLNNSQNKIKKEKSVLDFEKLITAPMPGTITNILVKENETVKKGQVLAILEAMKMENEIVAPYDGSIKSISIEKGKNVNSGDTLVKMA